MGSTVFVLVVEIESHEGKLRHSCTSWDVKGDVLMLYGVDGGEEMLCIKDFSSFRALPSHRQ